MQEADTSNEEVSWTTVTAIGSDDAFGDALTDSGPDYEGHGLLCLLHCFVAFYTATATATAVKRTHGILC